VTDVIQRAPDQEWLRSTRQWRHIVAWRHQSTTTYPCQIVLWSEDSVAAGIMPGSSTIIRLINRKTPMTYHTVS